MKAEIKDFLEQDAVLMGTLTGGIHEGTQITRQNTPGAFDANTEILPCALVKDGTDAPSGPHPDGTRLTLEIYFYQRAGYDNIKTAMQRVYNLLHRQNAWIKGVWEIRHADSLREIRDEALGCSLGLSRYEVYLNKAVTW